MQNKEAYDYSNEMSGAFRRGTLPADIVAEQKKLDAADLVIFQFPLHWYSWPAMLKGWIDRVMCNGYAFSYYPEMKIFNAGVFNVSIKFKKLQYEYSCYVKGLCVG